MTNPAIAANELRAEEQEQRVRDDRRPLLDEEF